MKKIRGFIGVATLIALGAPAWGQDNPPTPENIAKWVAQLGAQDFRTREQAGKELDKVGDAALPALRKASAGDLEPEPRRRVEMALERIEAALLKAEDKRWQDLDAPKRSIKDRVAKILARTPTLNDGDLTSAIYLISIGRRPTEAESAAARNQLKAKNHRLTSALRVAHARVQSMDFNADIAGANAKILKVEKDLPAGASIAKNLHWINSEECQKMTGQVAASLVKGTKSDANFSDVTFLVVLSRFPDANQANKVAAHLKAARMREVATTDVVWALINTKEFLAPAAGK